MLAIPPKVSFEDAAMTEPLACVLRGLHETGVEIGDTVAVIGGGPIGLMFVQVAKAIGCNVIAVVKRDSQVPWPSARARTKSCRSAQVEDPIEAVRSLTREKRGADVVIEAVGRPEAWEWAVQMVRKGGTVNFFGGCASGTKVQLDTNRLHYSEIYSEGHIPSHAGNRSPRFWADCRKESARHGLHYRRSAAFAPARCAAAHAEPQRRHQDCDHSRTLEPSEYSTGTKTRYDIDRQPANLGLCPRLLAGRLEQPSAGVRHPASGAVARGSAANTAAVWPARITRISPSPPGFCRSGCASISTTSTPIAGSPTI